MKVALFLEEERATFMPWRDADLRQIGGLVLGRSRATGCPVMVDPFDQQRFANLLLVVGVRMD